MSKSKEALALLDDLDSFTAPPAPAPTSTNATKSKQPKTSSLAPPRASTPVNDKDAAEALAFLDEMTQKTSEPRKLAAMPSTTTRVTLGGASRPTTPGAPSSGLRRSVETARPASKIAETSSTPGTSGGGWGSWGNVWNTASAALAQAKEKVDEQVKNLPQVPQIPQTDQAKKWGEGMMDYVKQAQLDKLAQDLRTSSLSTLSGTLTGIMNVMAPPISEHEVIEVTLSHEMEGYDGVESLVYRALARVLQQVEGGDLVVNMGKEIQSKSSRDLNAVEGLDAALKLSEAEIGELIKGSSPKQKSTESGPTTSIVFLRIQPYTSTASTATAPTSTSLGTKHTLQFLLYLSDPGHQLAHTTTTQSVPSSWMTLWDMDTSGARKNGDWIEEMLVEVLRVGVETIGQEYVVARMGWDAVLKAEAQSEKGEEGYAIVASGGATQ
ncbi:hypothetical protein FRB97_001186 [Tulasnella sp. 331]|nr:hypothetical protein FRB97_001186 [Tulasnella sp. 331]